MTMRAHIANALLKNTVRLRALSPVYGALVKILTIYFTRLSTFLSLDWVTILSIFSP